MTDILTKLAARTEAHKEFGLLNNRELALIALVREAAAEIERLRKLAAESRDALDAAIPCIGRDSSSFSTTYALRQAKEQRERCEQAINPPEAANG